MDTLTDSTLDPTLAICPSCGCLISCVRGTFRPHQVWDEAGDDWTRCTVGRPAMTWVAPEIDQ